MDYEPYLNKGLTSFQDVIKAFNIYKDGGFWVKKLIHGSGFIREIAEGPYKKKEANEKAKEWNMIFKYKNFVTANVYNFYDLCCKNTIDEEKKKELNEEHIWQPPKGTELFCLIYNPQNIVVKKKDEVGSKSFKQFYSYLANEDISYKDFREYKIFYNKKNYMSIASVTIAKRILTDFEDLNREKDLLLEYLINNKLNSDFIPIPNYLKQFKNSCFVIYLSFFRELLEKEKCNDRMIKFTNYLSKCLPEENLRFQDNEIRYNFFVLLNNRDINVKKFGLIRRKNNFELSMGDDKNYITLKNINSCSATLEIKLKDGIDYINMYYTQSDDRLRTIKSIMGLFFYLAKCMGISKIHFEANQQIECICNDQGVMLYEEVLALIDNRKSVYKDLGFVNKKVKELNAKLDSLENIKVRELLGIPKIEAEDEEEQEEDLFLDKTIKEMVQLYNNKICNIEYDCTIMDKIMKKVYPEIKDFMKYNLDLKSKNLKTIRAMF